jgi:hypothetical protein
MGRRTTIDVRERQLIVKLPQDGLSGRRIAGIIGRSPSAVTRIQSETPGLTPKRPFEPRYALTVQNVPEATMRLLSAAAARRHVSVEQMVLQIVVGVVHRAPLIERPTGFSRRGGPERT